MSEHDNDTDKVKSSDEWINPPPRPDSLAGLLAGITPAIYRRLKSAVELGRWENGDRLSPAQREHSLQLLIAYEARHAELADRIGYIVPAKGSTSCKS